MTDLHELLERATDRVESPELAAGALSAARRRRSARRAVVASSVAVLIVVGVALVGRIGGDRSPEPAPAPPTPEAPSRWDPRTADELPPAGAVAPGLPDVVETPASAPPLADQPVTAAVLSLDAGDAVLLLASDGSWRSVPPPSEFGSAQLTRDGTRLVVEAADGAEVWDLATGERQEVPLPDGFRDWDYTTWAWLDDDTLLLDDLNPGGWRIDVATGAAEQVAYPVGGLGRAVDAGGAVVEASDFSDPPRLTDWAGGPRRLALGEIGHLSSLQADATTVVGTAYDRGPFAVFVLDRHDVAVRARLPIRDHEANYSNGGLGVAALLPDGTVLLRVAVFRPELSWRLVAWEPAKGTLSLVTRGSGTVTSYAVAAIGSPP